MHIPMGDGCAASGGENPTAPMHPDRRGWGAFGAYSLSGELPREQGLRRLESEIAECLRRPATSEAGVAEFHALRARWEGEARELYGSLEPWETVFIARHPARPLVTDYVELLVQDFCELHGDRLYGDDRAIITGFGTIGRHPVMLIGQNRGRSLQERMACHFGCAHPEGYRKALAKMQLAAKFRLPIVSLIDTPGAYPGMEAEERGIARAIAANLVAMPNLAVPIVAVVIGEGGSGGALGIAVSDRMAMLEHSVFSVISPEGCAAILWKTSARAKEAASALRMRSRDLADLGLVDEVIPEPVGGAHRNRAETAASIEDFIVRSLDQLTKLPRKTLVAQRHERLRKMGASYERVCEEREAGQV